MPFRKNWILYKTTFEMQAIFSRKIWMPYLNTGVLPQEFLLLQSHLHFRFSGNFSGNF